MVQLLPAAICNPTEQVPPVATENGDPPGIKIVEIPSTEVPLFETVTVCAAVGVPTVPVKLRDGGVRVRTGTATCVPVPLSVAVWGDEDALSATLNITGVTVPLVVGVKITAMVQLELAARLVTPVHVPVDESEKGPEGSVIAMPVSGALPPLVRVRVCAAEATPTVLLKVSEDGVSEACG